MAALRFVTTTQMPQRFRHRSQSDDISMCPIGELDRRYRSHKTPCGVRLHNIPRWARCDEAVVELAGTNAGRLRHVCGLLSQQEGGPPTSTSLFGESSLYLKQTRRHTCDFGLETIPFPLKGNTLLQGILIAKLCSECLNLATHDISTN